MNKVQIFSTKIDALTKHGAQGRILLRLREGKRTKIYTPNTEIIMAGKEDPALAQLVNSGDLVVADGIGAVIASRLKGHPLPERVTGYDLSLYLMELGEKKGLSLYLLGGEPGVAAQAEENLRKTHPRLKVVGSHHGYFLGTHRGEPGTEEERKVVQDIIGKNPDILFVGLGFPGQEKWIDRHWEELPCKIAIGNGGVIDILSGKSKRAPDIFIHLHLEWFYRLLRDPSRWRRQLAIPKFLWAVLNDGNSVRQVEIKEEKDERD